MNKSLQDRLILAHVKAIFPRAIRAWDVGNCDSCKRKGLAFWIDSPQSPDNEGFISGGFYCLACGFGNAGKINAEVLLR